MNRAVVIGSLMLCTLASAAAVAQDTQPVDTPDTLAAKAAFKQFLQSISSGDEAAVKSQYGGEAQEYSRIAQLLRLTQAARRLATALQVKFPEAKNDSLLKLSVITPLVSDDRIDRDQVLMDGNTAHFRSGAAVSKINGDWKVRQLGGDPRQGFRLNQMASPMTDAINAVADDAAAGKFASVIEAKQALSDRMMAVQSTPFSWPTSRPAE